MYKMKKKYLKNMLSLLLTICLALNICVVNVFSAENSTSVCSLCIGGLYTSGTNLGKELQSSNRARSKVFFLNDAQLDVNISDNSIQYGVFYYDADMKCTGWSKWLAKSSVQTEQNSVYARIVFKYKDNHDISEMELGEFEKYLKYTIKSSDKNILVDGIVLGSCYLSGNQIGNEVAATNRARTRFYDLSRINIKVEVDTKEIQYGYFYYDGFLKCTEWSGWKSTSDTISRQDNKFVRIVFRFKNNQGISNDEIIELAKCVKLTPTLIDNTSTLKLGSLYTSGSHLGKELGSTTRARSDYYELKENRVKVELPESGQQYAVFFYDENKKCMGTSGWTNGSYKDIEGAVYVRVVFRYADNRVMEKKELPGLEAGIGFEKKETEPEATNGTCGVSLTWSFNSATGLLSIAGSGSMTNFSSAEETPWFKFKDSILSVEFNGENIEIGNHAFEGLNISSIDLTNVISVGDCAFKNCKNIQGLVDGSNLTWIGEGSFENCSNITSIYIGSNVTYIGDYAIKDCSNLTSIVVAEKTKFDGNINLKGVNNSITIIIGNNMYVPIGDNDTPTIDSTTVINFSKDENGETIIKQGGKPDIIPPIGAVAERATISGENKVVEGKSVTLYGEIYPANAVNRGFTWTTSDETIAVVDEVSEDTKTVTISGIKVGEVTVKAVNKNNGVIAEFAITVTCAHDWENGTCIKCGEICEHEWKDGTCTICKKDCLHKWTNGICEICGLECNHEFVDSKCSVCGYECVEHKWSDGICSICGTACEHDWSNKDGVCTVCGKICEHENFENGICVVCGMKEPTTGCQHDWSNCDGVCAICGEKCTHDGESYWQETRFDYDYEHNENRFIVQHNLYCSICNVNITEECYDSDNNGLCDVCGECMHMNLQKEQINGHMHNITCIDCNKEIAAYEICQDMDGDNICDICGNWITRDIDPNPGMNECTCGCGMVGCTCGPECPLCNNASMTSSDSVTEEFNNGNSDVGIFTSGNEGKNDFKDALG